MRKQNALPFLLNIQVGSLDLVAFIVRNICSGLKFSEREPILKVMLIIQKSKSVNL